jgi:hypothetical protein
MDDNDNNNNENENDNNGLRDFISKKIETDFKMKIMDIYNSYSFKHTLYESIF